MKIQQRSSIPAQVLFQFSENTSLQETQTQQVQVQSSQNLASDAEKAQRLGELKSQEQLLRADLHQKFSPSDSSNRSINKQLDGSMMSGGQFELNRLIFFYESMHKQIVIENDSFTSEPAQRTFEILKALKLLQEGWNDLPVNRRVVMDSLGRILFDGTGSGENPPSLGPNDRSHHDAERNPGAHTPSIIDIVPGRQGRRPSSSTSGSNPSSDSPATSNRDASGTSGNNETQGTSGTSGGTREPRESGNDRHKGGGTEGTDDRDGNSSGGGYENDYHDRNTGVQVISPEGYAPGEYGSGQSLPGDYPMTGKGRPSGNDIGVSGRLPKSSPDNRAHIDQLLQPEVNAVNKETGAADEERPVVGDRSNATQQGSHNSDDLGDDMRGRIQSTGGEGNGRAIGQELLQTIRPINPGGPDPSK